MGKKKDARIAQNEANMQEMQIELKNDVINSQVQAGGEDQMSPEMQEILTARRNEVATSMGSGINMKGGCQIKKHMKSSGMNMSSSSRHDSGGPKMAPLIGMAVKALAPMVMGKMADKLGEKFDK